MKMSALILLVTPMLVLLGTAVAVLLSAGVAGIANPGAHGYSEILYAFSSAANNNGSAFAGLSANTPFYNTMLAVAMWLGRFAIIIRCWPLQAHWPPKSVLPPMQAPCPPTARCLSRC